MGEVEGPIFLFRNISGLEFGKITKKFIRNKRERSCFFEFLRSFFKEHQKSTKRASDEGRQKNRKL